MELSSEKQRLNALDNSHHSLNLQQGANKSTEDSASHPFASSFTFAPIPLTKYDDHVDYILNIAKYIPVGCLRALRSDFHDVTSETWESCQNWAAVSHPRDNLDLRRSQFLSNDLQQTLLSSSFLNPYLGLLNAGWIRMEFKTNVSLRGQFRVYILPSDVGRATIARDTPSLRRSMPLLIAQLDISNETWNGNWIEDLGHAHIDASLNRDRPRDEESLFHIFNNLPSPKPEPRDVIDDYARTAIYQLLDGDVEGLKTTMYPYQRRTAALMLQREAQPARMVDPRLRQMVDQKGSVWYCDANNGSCLSEPRTYELAKGGICAETMGLGKTLICLSLIMATRGHSSHIPVEYSVGLIPTRKKTGSLREICAATIGRTSTPWKHYFAQAQADGIDMIECVAALKEGAGFYYLPSPEPKKTTRSPSTIKPRKIWLSTTTIIVVPDNLVTQWLYEIKRHTVGLKVFVAGKRVILPPAKELADYDIILFSRKRFDNEAKEGCDARGRIGLAPGTCDCPDKASIRGCKCFPDDSTYESPLKDLHFKRLITDEGHTFGNGSKIAKTEAAIVIDFLRLDARWIISGTPTAGLYGVEVSGTTSVSSSVPGTPSSKSNEGGRYRSSIASASVHSMTTISAKDQAALSYIQERKDLQKLGNIATMYLKARPWANTTGDEDVANWAHHVMQPRHGAKSHGNTDCLRATMESIIIRHRPEDVNCDVSLPPLTHDVIYLDPSMQDKLSLNTFSMMIISNAITSERQGVDYLFHPRQKKALQELVSNLRQASFFWSGYQPSDVELAIKVSQGYLDDDGKKLTHVDRLLLLESIKIGKIIIKNAISKAASYFHEMPMYIENTFTEEVRKSWSLDGATQNPTLMGPTMLFAAQKFVHSQSWKEDPAEGLATIGDSVMGDAWTNAGFAIETPSRLNKNTTGLKIAKNGSGSSTALAGGVTLGDGPMAKKRRLSSASVKASVSTSTDPAPEKNRHTKRKQNTPNNEDLIEINAIAASATDAQFSLGDTPKLKSAPKKTGKENVVGTLDPSSSLTSAAIVSTTSAKLSYLMDRILIHQTEEKIIVFYEVDNVAFYISQALECIGVKHLIFAKGLKVNRRADYLATFNQSELFRVLLMDVSQAAFGLDISSASRVYFIHPVFSPQIQAQAIKRVHRIGQARPVFVETLVLKGSMEELILERKENMSNEEHNKCKHIIDDHVIKHWIRNAQFLPISPNVPGPEQMAKLENHPLVFSKRDVNFTSQNPEADLVKVGEEEALAKQSQRGQEDDRNDQILFQAVLRLAKASGSTYTFSSRLQYLPTKRATSSKTISHHMMLSRLD